MKITNVEEKQGREKPYWNITIEGGPSKYANWFEAPAPQVGQTEFELVKGKEYTDKQGKLRNYYNAKADRLSTLVKRVEAIENYLQSGMRAFEKENKQQPSTPRPDTMNGDPMGGIPDDETPPF